MRSVENADCKNIKKTRTVKILKKHNIKEKYIKIYLCIKLVLKKIFICTQVIRYKTQHNSFQ